MRALVTGATGFVGQALCNSLIEPVVLTRNPEKARRVLGDKTQCFEWHPAKEKAPSAAFEGIDTVFNLAGESIAGRWNSEKKAKIRNSRVIGTENLCQTLAKLATPPKVLISASAVGYYGDRGDEVLEESSSAGTDFLSQVCQQWEERAAAARDSHIRVVHARFGIILGKTGGALSQMLTPFKLGLGGTLGSGSQWMSWVHIQDVVGQLLHAANNASVAGAMNVVAPMPVTNKEFTQTLGKVLKRPTILPAPSPLLRIVLGEFSDVLLGSQRVRPLVAHQSGYAFKFQKLEEALADLLA